MVLTKILMSLPERFKHFRAAWESVPSNKQDINHLTSRLLVEEDRIGKPEEEAVALVSTKCERKCYICGNKGHMKNQCKKNMECFHCKNKGALMKDYFHKKQKERGENKQQKEQRSTSSNFALVTVSSDIESQVEVRTSNKKNNVVPVATLL
ncbi:Zinc knuckle [Popillia japonica]|uniref:Zinc knuckle n=1 Tax=Popillia japonica TaxID=7064 RepID=A0AAW1JFG2_POPJA